MTWRFRPIDRALQALACHPLTVRTVLVGVAVLAVVLALATEPGRRRARFLERAAWHEARIEGFHGPNLNTKYMPIDRDHQPITGRRLALDQWHLNMMLKYQDAAREPMRPVRPDPPMP